MLSADLRVDGDVFSAGPVQIDGEVLGDIHVQDLTVGAGARLSGRIDAEVAKISGTVTGQIDARSVQLLPSASVTGDILHEDLTIETGAFVNGNFKRAKKVERPEPDMEPLELDDEAPRPALEPVAVAAPVPQDETVPGATRRMNAASRD